MKYLSLKIPGFDDPIKAPGNIPTGGFTDGSTTGNDVVLWALGLAFIFASVLTLFLIVFGGIQWVMSGGDKEKIANARKRIMYAIFGLVVVVFSMLIINLILYFLGAPSLTLTSFPNINPFI